MEILCTSVVASMQTRQDTETLRFNSSRSLLNRTLLTKSNRHGSNTRHIKIVLARTRYTHKTKHQTIFIEIQSKLFPKLHIIRLFCAP